MSLSIAVKKKFESRIGSSIDELDISDSPRKDFQKTPLDSYGRGYVHFGRSISPKQKDEENLKILAKW